MMQAVAEIETVPISLSWERLHPAGFSNGVFMLMTWGYMDESGDSQEDLFSLSVIVAVGFVWLSIEERWKAVLEKKNAGLLAAGRKLISRYHASNCSSRVGEFEGWSVPEQVEFSKELISILNSETIESYGYTLSLKRLKAEVPEVSKNPEGFARILLLQMLMNEIGERRLARQKDVLVSLIHDRSDYDGVMSDAFNDMLQDEKFKFRNRFTTIASQSWRQCIALQPADLIAYENFKESERHMRNLARERRKSLTAILDEGPGLFGGSVGGWTQATYEEVRRQLDRLEPDIKQQLLSKARA